MPNLFPRRPALLIWTAALLALAATPRLAADLAWSPATGWKLEEGSLSGLTGAQGRGALDMMNKARQAEESGRISAALKAYGKAADKYKGSVFAPEALYREGRLLEGRKQFYKAFMAFQSVLRLYPNTKRFNEVIGEQYRIASALLDGVHNRIFGGLLPGIANRTKGIEYFEVILLTAPYSDYAPLALMDIARGYQREKSHEEAIDALDRLVNTYPQSVLAPVAYLRLGDLHASLSEGPKYDQASTKEAMTYYEDYMILPGRLEHRHRRNRRRQDEDDPRPEQNLHRGLLLLQAPELQGRQGVLQRGHHLLPRVRARERREEAPGGGGRQDGQERGRCEEPAVKALVLAVLTGPEAPPP